MTKSAAVSAPAGYNWVCVWPLPSRTPRVVTGLVVSALGVLLGAQLDMPTTVVIVFVLFSLMIAVTDRVPPRAAIVVRNNKAVLTFRPLSSPVFQATCLIAALCVTFIWGVPSRIPESVMRVGGIIVLVILTPPLLIISLTRNQLIFGERALRLVMRMPGRHFDREFSWNGMTTLKLVPFLHDRPTKNPAISFRCLRASVIDRSRTKPRNIGKPTENEWLLNTANWTVEPNALLATFRFMTEHPELRPTITPDHIAAMLTPPRNLKRHQT